MCTYNAISSHTDHFEIQKWDSEESLLTFVNLFVNLFSSYSWLEVKLWIFIKPCKHVYICKTNTLDKKVRARDNSFRVISLCSSKWLLI